MTKKEIEKRLAAMGKDERSLLLYLESCAVDGYAKLDQRRMNDIDRAYAEEWNRVGFIQYGRVKAEEISRSASKCTHFAILSNDAWTMAHMERRNRANRTIIMENFNLR